RRHRMMNKDCRSRGTNCHKRAHHSHRIRLVRCSRNNRNSDDRFGNCLKPTTCCPSFADDRNPGPAGWRKCPLGRRASQSTICLQRPFLGTGPETVGPTVYVEAFLTQSSAVGPNASWEEEGAHRIWSDNRRLRPLPLLEIPTRPAKSKKPRSDEMNSDGP